VIKGLERLKSFTWQLHSSKLVPFKHTRSHSKADLVDPLSEPKKILRKASSKRGHQPYSSSSSVLHSKYLASFDPYSNIPPNPNHFHSSPRVVEPLEKGVYFKSAFLIHSFESHPKPSLQPRLPKTESDLGVNLPEYKPTDFISPTTYSFPPTFGQPQASTYEQPEQTFSVYSNPLFETKEAIHPQVQKLVLKTPLKSFRRSPPSSPPTSSSPPQSPFSTPSSPSSTSSSTQTPHTPRLTMAFQPIVQARYAALVLPPNLDALLAGYLKYLPRYNGGTSPSIEDHILAFLDFANNMNIEQEIFYMRLFVQSLEGNVRIWFR